MIDDLLRSAVRDMADESYTPSGIASRAMAQGHRIRRARRTATVAAALAAVLAVTVPFVLLRDPSVRPRPLPAASPVIVHPTFDRAEVFRGPGGARLLGFSKSVDSFVLDAGNGYRQLPATDTNVLPSPDGRHVAVQRPGHESVQILDLRTGDYWKPPVPSQSFLVWSDDGSRLLLTQVDGYSIVEPATRWSVTHRLAAARLPCLGICPFTWSGGTTEVASPQVWTRGDDDTQINGLAIFDAKSGELLRELPIKGAPRDTNSWSADGRWVLVSESLRSLGQKRVVEVASRRESARFTAEWAGFLPDGTVLAQSGGVLTRYGTDGAVLEKAELPAELRGQNLTFGF
ncbi:hypothetical protein AMIS_81020 [Actinoplanes missouriensis 431]|uniref:WD40 repeat domain-containing protein n=1 Tax=Actinoplanes missouriensis (strain ATCC 14538 / DSM 43046 / CBS 188.64 / JCM 3121 / NBRC 102363 / NCIMB 12654 / NRRL B-3342 / UNCC 431) TaxID=512565 RepID=I0HJY5_ACTM4|nr:hypothetical protein [Actinoplanes missouriensis]BAL93322.1 hypothetical protein AMIS_81020 [Actinoplanes missouriensis 431]